MGKGVNKNGSLDKRIWENRVKFLNKDGSLDMCCNVNREVIRSFYVISLINILGSGRFFGEVRFFWELLFFFYYVSGFLEEDGIFDVCC